MPVLESRELSTAELPAWDSLVQSSPQGTVFHTSAWLQTYASSTRARLLVMGCFDDGKLVGGCPLFVTGPWIMRFASSHGTLTPYGGVIREPLQSESVRETELHATSIITSILDAIARKKFLHTSLILSPGVRDIRPFLRRGWKPSVHYTYLFPLDGEVKDRISRNRRQAIRRAQKLEISCDTCRDPQAYWDLVVSTYARQNTFPPFPKTHVTAFLDLIAAKDIGEIWMAKTASGEVAAAEVIVWDNKLAHRWSAASSKDLIDTGAPSLLLYTILQDLKKRSFPTCNFFSGNSEQLTTFASSFNPLLQPYYSVGSFNMEYTLHRIARPFYHALLAVPFLNPSRR